MREACVSPCCNSIFGKTCIEQHLSKHGTCFICESQLDLAELVENGFVKKEVGMLFIKCSNENCSIDVTVNMIEEHERLCLNEFVCDHCGRTFAKNDEVSHTTLTCCKRCNESYQLCCDMRHSMSCTGWRNRETENTLDFITADADEHSIVEFGWKNQCLSIQDVLTVNSQLDAETDVDTSADSEVDQNVVIQAAMHRECQNIKSIETDTGRIRACPFAEFGCEFKGSASAFKQHYSNSFVHLLIARNLLIQRDAILVEKNALLARLNAYQKGAKKSAARLVLSYSSEVKMRSQPEKNGYYGGVYSPLDNCIYFGPWAQCDEREWHYVDLNQGGKVFPYYNQHYKELKPAMFQQCVLSVDESRIYFYPGPKCNGFFYYLDLRTRTVEKYYGIKQSRGQISYYGGALNIKSNCIFLAPHYPDCNHAITKWHFIDCSNNSIHSYASEIIEKIERSSYRGAIYCPTNNRVFFIPYREKLDPELAEWHYVDCETFEVVAYSAESDFDIAPMGYTDAVFCPANNRIYLMPDYQAPLAYWHYIDCLACKVHTYSSDTEGTGLEVQAYSGGVYSPLTHRIYLTPYNRITSTTWHYIDCLTATVVSYESLTSMKESEEAYANGVYCEKMKRAYFAPFGQADQSYWQYIQE